ncbi:hypothetical protein EYF80_030811 [Liparis tanakae]|uniref:Uncharacterized protein n=1 Tax=Liparis tanakae TaxID=230148 RepID=A0A4Z2GZD2_9TELE|nr:hypothetical protein EYF80_030811 [Liparis tanakae]
MSRAVSLNQKHSAGAAGLPVDRGGLGSLQPTQLFSRSRGSPEPHSSSCRGDRLPGGHGALIITTSNLQTRGQPQSVTLPITAPEPGQEPGHRGRVKARLLREKNRDKSCPPVRALVLELQSSSRQVEFSPGGWIAACISNVTRLHKGFLSPRPDTISV